ncbi:hypothetical protein EB796_019001 [Bugula neritina]|uniref:Uncharacterized protein n=1 Tax=Bugula neritina TaxID=10212 RepID=A0A7J7J9J6_BUGNE|nr:hypothetical protein EB796_019001 [Bugula neritina]
MQKETSLEPCSTNQTTTEQTTEEFPQPCGVICSSAVDLYADLDIASAYHSNCSPDLSERYDDMSQFSVIRESSFTSQFSPRGNNLCNKIRRCYFVVPLIVMFILVNIISLGLIMGCIVHEETCFKLNNDTASKISSVGEKSN